MTGTDNPNPGNFANRYVQPPQVLSRELSCLTSIDLKTKSKRLLPRAESPATLAALPAWTPTSRSVNHVSRQISHSNKSFSERSLLKAARPHLGLSRLAARKPRRLVERVDWLPNVLL